jgi:hypothetical protein
MAAHDLAHGRAAFDPAQQVVLLRGHGVSLMSRSLLDVEETVMKVANLVERAGR